MLEIILCSRCCLCKRREKKHSVLWYSIYVYYSACSSAKIGVISTHESISIPFERHIQGD